MTFEDKGNCAATAGADETTAPMRPKFQFPPTWSNKAADEMLGFVDRAALVADDLRGLAKLLRGIFEASCDNLSVEEDAALRIVGDCISNMAARLDSNCEHARARRNHLASEGAR